MYFRRKTVPLDQMPDDSFATIRRLSDDDLHRLIAGESPHSARHIAASREVQWRQDRTHVIAQWTAVLISIGSLVVALFALFGCPRN
jgi:hypothetical protein